MRMRTQQPHGGDHAADPWGQPPRSRWLRQVPTCRSPWRLRAPRLRSLRTRQRRIDAPMEARQVGDSRPTGACSGTAESTFSASPEGSKRVHFCSIGGPRAVQDREISTRFRVPFAIGLVGRGSTRRFQHFATRQPTISASRRSSSSPTRDGIELDLHASMLIRRRVSPSDARNLAQRSSGRWLYRSLVRTPAFTSRTDSNDRAALQSSMHRYSAARVPSLRSSFTSPRLWSSHRDPPLVHPHPKTTGTATLPFCHGELASTLSTGKATMPGNWGTEVKTFSIPRDAARRNTSHGSRTSTIRSTVRPCRHSSPVSRVHARIRSMVLIESSGW